MFQFLDTYSSAILRLKKLENKTHAYSPNVQLDESSQSVVATEVYKCMANFKPKQLTLREKLLNVPKEMEQKKRVLKKKQNLRAILVPKGS